MGLDLRLGLRSRPRLPSSELQLLDFVFPSNRKDIKWGKHKHVLFTFKRFTCFLFAQEMSLESCRLEEGGVYHRLSYNALLFYGDKSFLRS